MSLFGKKKSRKVEVQHEDSEPRRVEINVAPLVQVDEVKVQVNGKEKAPVFRIAIANRDVIELSEREYDELLDVMLARCSDNELVHRIWEQHNAKHQEQDALLQGLGDMLQKSGLGELLAKMRPEMGE